MVSTFLDISQTIVQEYFNMMMIVDMGKMKKSFEDVADELADVGKGYGCADQMPA